MSVEKRFMEQAPDKQNVVCDFTLADLVEDFADALRDVDASRVAHKNFRPGIGPYGEAAAIKAALEVLKTQKPGRYGSGKIKKLPDLLIPGSWAIEVKVVRPYGDNGKVAEHCRRTFSTHTKATSVLFLTA